jgi:hypothetical protein
VSTLITDLPLDNSGLVPHGSLLGVLAVLTADPDAAIERDSLYALVVTAVAFSARAAELEDEVDMLAADLDDATLDILAFGDEVKP